MNKTEKDTLMQQYRAMNTEEMKIVAECIPDEILLDELTIRMVGRKQKIRLIKEVIADDCERESCELRDETAGKDTAENETEE